jgi:hypothetical protein
MPSLGKYWEAAALYAEDEGGGLSFPFLIAWLKMSPKSIGLTRPGPLEPLPPLLPPVFPESFVSGIEATAMSPSCPFVHHPDASLGSPLLILVLGWYG